MAELKIITRAEVGLLPPLKRREMKACAGIIVHCTGGAQPTSAKNSLIRWRSVQSYHMGSKGWDDTGYSFGFDDFGQILEGRGWNTRGSHSGPGWNGYYHGICYLGSGEQPTHNALCALYRFIREHDARYPTYKGKLTEVIGHRDIANKACPGDGVYEYLVEHFGDRNPHH